MSEKFLSYTTKLVNEIEAHDVRADIDDRMLTLQKRVRDAEREWIPYIIVVGRQEVESEILPVRDRQAGGIRRIKLNKLIGEIKNLTATRPFRAMPLPKFLSKRPQFFR
jgi:threonyl-tRNA synthetase